jgi:hypothetical protein
VQDGYRPKSSQTTFAARKGGEKKKLREYLAKLYKKREENCL